MKLFTPCSLCKGTLKLLAAGMIDGMRRPDGSTYSGPLREGEACPCLDSTTPGWADTGLTVGQVDKARENSDALVLGVARVIESAATKYSCCPQLLAAITALSDLMKPYTTRVQYLRASAQVGKPPEGLPGAS